jgi:hypothetical protein
MARVPPNAFANLACSFSGSTTSHFAVVRSARRADACVASRRSIGLRSARLRPLKRFLAAAGGPTLPESKRRQPEAADFTIFAGDFVEIIAWAPGPIG